MSIDKFTIHSVHDGFKKLKASPPYMNLPDKFDFQEFEGLKKDVFYLGLTVLLAGLTVAVSNYNTPDEPVNVGTVEVSTQCVGLDAGVCLGFQQRDHTTYNYVNWTDAEPGTADYYRRVEAELMVRAYNTCTEEMNGMDWTSEVSYENKTAAEWNENENIQLLPCEKTFYRPLK